MLIMCTNNDDYIDQDQNWASRLGVPNTKSIIKKWSVKHLGGIDLTELGPPHPIERRSGLSATIGLSATSTVQPPLSSTLVSTHGNIIDSEINQTDIITI